MTQSLTYCHPSAPAHLLTVCLAGYTVHHMHLVVLLQAGLPPLQEVLLLPMLLYVVQQGLGLATARAQRQDLEQGASTWPIITVH
jgi:hypothetical protein